MLRLLYIDVPFEQEPGGDMNRSRFLWATLSQAFDAELLLLQLPGKYLDLTEGPRSTSPRVTVVPAEPAGFPSSPSVLTFAPAAMATFDALLHAGRFDLVFTRFHSAWRLARAADDHPTRPAVVMDLDMLSSRLVELSWQQRPSFRNRWFLFEMYRLQWLERRIAQRPFLFLLSNPAELHYFRSSIALDPAPGRFAALPNVLSAAPVSISAPQRQILFFGSLNSAANTDGFRYLVDQVFPLIETDLQRLGVRIMVAGKNPPPWFAERIAALHTDRLVLVGGVPSMERAIAESLFVLLPLRVASGTRTRILEAAAQRRTVVTTPIGAEGIEVGDDALVCSTPQFLASAIVRLLEDPALAAHLGRRLHDRCLHRYAARIVATELVRELHEFATLRPARGRASPGHVP